MKLTPALEDFLTEIIKGYSTVLGLEIPMILLTDEELGGMVDNYKQFKEIKEGCIGESWHRRDTGFYFNVVYINAENTDFLWQLIDVIVHELVHLKFPDLKHGKKFQEKINSIIMGL